MRNARDSHACGGRSINGGNEDRVAAVLRVFPAWYRMHRVLQLQQQLSNKKVAAAANAKALVDAVTKAVSKVDDSLSDARADLDCISDELQALIQSVQALTAIFGPA